MTENTEQRSRLYAAAILAMALAFCIGIALTAASVWAAAPTTNLPAQAPGRPHLPSAPQATDTPTDTPTPAAILVGHVIWQGARPISLTLSMSITEINYPTQNTDASGYFTVSVDGLANGTYDYRAKGPKYLAKAGTVTLTGAPITQLEIGSMTVGDANNDNIVDTIDYSILKATYGRSCGDPLYDARADFDNNCIVNTIDFGDLKVNFARVGAPPDSPIPPSSGDAFLKLQPGSTAGNCPAPASGGTVQVGCRFVLDLMLSMGSVPDGVAEQSYLTFTHSIIQNARVSSIATSCVPTGTVTVDGTVFDASLQNEVCNDQPGGCTFRLMPVGNGSMAFASGPLNNSPSSGTFRVAQVGLCAVAPGQAVLHWQFSPPAPRNRHTDIVDASGNLVQVQSSFTDYVINVVGSLATGTPTPIPTDTPVPTVTNTPLPTNTPTITPSSTPTSIPTDTPSGTITPPPGVINGHLTWQGVAHANYPLVTGTLTLCVNGSPQSFGPFNTDTNGNFALTTNLPDGTYNWFIKGGRHISNSSPTDGAALVISGGQATQEFGLQRGGDIRQTGIQINIVNSTDFSDLKFMFGMSGTLPADLDYNQVVNVLDFTILKANFGQSGHAFTCP